MLTCRRHRALTLTTAPIVVNYRYMHFGHWIQHLMRPTFNRMAICKSMIIRILILSMLAIGMAAMASGAAWCQDYPNKTVRIVTGAAGGTSDFISRQIAQAITGALGQPVVVDNRPGSVLPIEAVSKAAPDGYNLLIQGSTVWVFPLLQKAPYDPVRDFAPISLLTREPSMLAVHPSLPVRSLKELLALVKARPGDINYGSTVGGMSHLGTELLKSMTRANIVHVPYKGVAAVTTAVISGEVQMVIMDATFLAPHVKSGRLRGLAVTTAEPSLLLPDLPTMASSGLPGFDVAGRTGIYAPVNTPAAIVNRLNREVVRAVNSAEVKQKFLGVGVEPVGSSPEQFAAIIKSEYSRLGQVVRDAGIKLN